VSSLSDAFSVLQDTLSSFSFFYLSLRLFFAQGHSFEIHPIAIMFSSTTLLTSIAFLGTTGWAQYALQDDYCGNGNFYDNFDFYNGSDPTNGYVDYVERDYAQSAGLISEDWGKVYMGVDHSGIASKAGRPAVRIESRKTYDSGLIIIDIEHMPGGICGTWPAFWMFGPNWPKNGEIGEWSGLHCITVQQLTAGRHHRGSQRRIHQRHDPAHRSRLQNLSPK
jgi:hypothetical protein